MPNLGPNDRAGKAGPAYRATTNGSEPGHAPVSDDRAGDDAPHLGPDLVEYASRLAERGYVVLPASAKIPFKAWNDRDLAKRRISPSKWSTTAEKIGRWPKQYPLATTIGVQVRDGLGFIDLDIG